MAMTSDDELRNAATAIMEKRRLDAKILLLTCHHCKEYFECVHFEHYCINCRPTGRAT
jgi:hypothetical protein